MRQIIAPRWALNAQAIDAAGSPHLPPGIHLRVLPSPVLGLPVTPLLIHRANLGPDAINAQLRSDITWVDSRGRQLAAPFTVTPDNPVTGYLPAPEYGLCCWIRLLGRPARAVQPIPLPEARRPIPPILRRPIPGLPIRPIAPIPIRPVPPIVRPLQGELKVEAILTTAVGPGVIATTTSAPYDLGASRIEQIRVSGRGEVEGVRWIDAHTVRAKWQAIGLMALPHPGGARYAGIPQAPQWAKARVQRGAPLRLGLHDRPGAANPGAAPPATPADDWNRVAHLKDQGVEAWVERLINDTSAPPWALTDQQSLADDQGVNRGTIDLNLLNLTLSGAHDPGMARWLGLLERDVEVPANHGDVLLYAVGGFWDFNRQRLGENGLVVPPDILADAIPASMHDTRLNLDRFRLKGPFLGLWTVTGTTMGAPPDPPRAPALGPPVSGEWLPATPPDAQRVVTLPVGGLWPGAGLALARREPSGTITGLNPRLQPIDRALPVVMAEPPDATETGTGSYTDRQAPPEPFRFRAAQADWFGRWSGWAERQAPGQARPRPPRPVIFATYAQPTLGAGPAPGGLLSGTLQVRVPVPAPEVLAPGSHLLAKLEVVVSGMPLSVINIPVPASPPAFAEISLTGPGIVQASSTTVTVTGRWVDTTSIKSLDAEPVTLSLYDPRPPAQVSLPSTLQYASRPDVTGLARTTLSWTAAANQASFRIYYADETGVKAKLEGLAAGGDANASAILTALAGLAAPDRAAVLVANKQYLTRSMFELLTGEPLPGSPGAAMSFEHALSGSLRVLSLYRLLSVSTAQVEANFADSALVPFGVPNTGAPTQPTIVAKPLLDADGQLVLPYQVELALTVPRGVVPAVGYRLRRSATTSSDGLNMPVATTGLVPLPDPLEKGPQRTSIADDGTLRDFATATALKPFTTYYYRAEVQGAPEPGGGPEGRWSAPSPAVSAMLVPPAAPEPVTAVALVPAGADLEVRFAHPDPLAGGSVGTYSLDIYRQVPGEAEVFAGSLSADTPAALGGRNPDRTGQFRFRDPVPAGTRYRVVVVDPLGRTSTPSAPVTL